MPTKLASPDEDVMIFKFPAASKLALLLGPGAGAMVRAHFAVTANAQSPRSYDDRGRPSYGSNRSEHVLSAGAAYQDLRHQALLARRRRRVLPGDRKFLDCAASDAPSFGVQNNNEPTERQPLDPPSDLGGGPTKFPLY